MSGTLEFYFDFSSPYGYLAAQRIDALGEELGRDVIWRPFLLGAVFKETGSQPLLGIPLKGDYARLDLERSARRMGVPMRFPDSFPFASVAACRAFYALEENDPAMAVTLAVALYEAAFGRGEDINKPENVLSIAGTLGLDLADRLGLPEIKERLRHEVEGALNKGVFGSPFFIVEGESFWGHDRMDDLADWVRQGGW
ncbi:MAG: 2-hydroxychromene-2-carboxylate isomerase [Pseudomonadota bacterium]